MEASETRPADNTDVDAIKRIVVVGAVAAGMSCAARARRLDENVEIIVFERGEYVSFANCGLPYYVGGEIEDSDDLLLHTPESLRETRNIDVRIHHEVTGIDPDSRTVTVSTPHGMQHVTYDALVLTPGAVAVTPPIDGLDSARVWTLRTVDDALALRERVVEGARRAVVLGAGFIGLEAAEAFIHQGLEVTIVELAPHVLPPLEPELAALIADELTDMGVATYSGVGAERIESGEAEDVITLSNGTTVAADVIVLATGVKPATEAFVDSGIELNRGAIVVDHHGQTSLPNVWAAGDATASRDAVTGAVRPVPLAGPANRAGRLVADSILRPAIARPVPNPLGTAIVRVGTLTAAITGANRKMLDHIEIAYETINLHSKHHAGYFPGATDIHLIVHFRSDDGLILGAQAVGENGVDKRIDVLATAIRSGLVIDDLIDLDLTYSPPYGQAKDIVNLAGMVGQNVRNASLKQWQARDIDQVVRDCLILDVRSQAEYESGHLAAAINVPLSQLRSQLSELRGRAGGKPVRIVCGVGLRSAQAHRILDTAGFDSASLAGGMQTVSALKHPLIGQTDVNS